MRKMHPSARRLAEKRTASTLWRTGLAAIAMGAVPASLWSQGPLLPRQAESIADQPFARFDDSLTRAADTLRASAAQNTTAASPRMGMDEISCSSAGIQFDLPSQSSLGNSRLSQAAARLDLLRPLVEPILRSRGVPTELAAVILVESGGRPTALSPKGARGLWQLMPETARRYGLRVDEIQDDRLDLFMATGVAAQYLHDLYAQFGDWKLALAAYNTGEANVAAAILRAHTQDFDQLTRLGMLPLETRDYVPRVLTAVHPSGQLSALGEYHPAIRVITVFAVSNR